MRLIAILLGLVIFSSCKTELNEESSNQNANNISDTGQTSYNSQSKEYSWLEDNLYLLGYKSQRPVFKSWDSNRLYIFKDTLEVLKNFSKAYKPIYINDVLTIYKENKKMILEYEDSTNIILLESELLSASSNTPGDSIFFSNDYSGNILLYQVTNDQILKTNLRGWEPNVVGKYVYYLKDMPEYSWAIKIFRSKLNDLNNSEIILDKVHDEGLTFFPNDSLIGIHANIVKDVRPAIFNINRRKYAFIDNVTQNIYYPFYLSRNSLIGYYTISGFKTYFAKIPTAYYSDKDLGINYSK